MKLELVRYTCANCAIIFEAPALGENVYGEFLLSSKNGEAAYLNVFVDSTYKQLDNMLSIHPRTAALLPLERAKVLRHIYGGLTCDPDDKSSSFEMEAYPPCARCCSRNIKSWEFKSPPEIVDIPIQPVTHDRWSALSDFEKLKLLDEKLATL